MKLIVSAVMIAAVAAGAQAETLKQLITRTNSKVSALLKAKDIKGFEKYCKPMMTKDFVCEEEGQKMTFAQMVENMKVGLGSLNKVTKAEAKLISLKETKTTGVATYNSITEGTVVGPDKKTHTMTFLGKMTEHYRLEKGKWMMYKMVFSDSKMKMDGKAVDPSQMGAG
ncbi:MAG TPA: hypothetical protein VK171_07310 [Fimbriimonas sp.]|nr:hypothetical protein [Fimbriimonas sp.]